MLNATIRHHLVILMAKLMKAFYVDDLVAGAEDEAQAYQFYQSAKAVMKAGGFNLRKFLSSSASLQSRIDAGQADIRSFP